MIFNCFEWTKDTETPKIHPNQKPLGLIKQLIEIFTDEGDIVIDPVAGSGISLIAAEELGRKAYGFEIKKDFFRESQALIERFCLIRQEKKEYGFAKTVISKENAILF